LLHIERSPDGADADDAGAIVGDGGSDAAKKKRSVRAMP